MNARTFTFVTKICLSIALLALSNAGNSLCAQGISSPYRQLSTAVNTPVADTVSGLNLDINIIFPVAKHGDVDFYVLALGGAGNPWVYEIVYTPDPGFIGVDTFALEYNYIGSYPYLTYRAFRISVFQSLLQPRPDFTTTLSGTSVTMNVLANDFSSTPPLSLSNITAVDHGTATIAGNEVVFDPEPGFSGTAHFNYTVCDASGQCKNAYSSIGVHATTVPVTDSMQVFVSKNAVLSIPLVFDGYTLFQAPAHGTVLAGGQFFRYTPTLNYSGNDQFVLTDTLYGNTVFKTVSIVVLNTPTQNVMAIEDYAYTPKNKAITFNVLDNDIGNLYVKGWTVPANFPGTITNTNSSGNVKFTPNANFSGVATFYYKLGNNNVPDLEIGTVNVIIGDLPPAAGIFDLTTPKETPLAINYKIPFIGFNFSVVDAPDHGTCTYYPGQTTQNFAGQSVTGYNMLIYTPATGFVGLDEFEVSYCIPFNGNCQSVKIVMNVTDVLSSNGPYCFGDDCVWTGDINNDGIVNNKDLLPLGYLMGAKGTNRPNASLEWYGQHSTNWNNPYAETGVDVKYADTDGDGEVTAIDTLALGLFYNQTHQFTPKIPTAGKGLPFFLHFLTPPNPGVGDFVQIEVDLGDAAYPVTDLYGFTFDVSLSPLIEDSAFHFNWYSNSWLNVNAPYLTLAQRPRKGRFETAFTRSNGVSASGMGSIAAFDFIIVDVIQGGRPGHGSDEITLTIDNPVFLFGNGQTVEDRSVTFTIPIQTQENTAPSVTNEQLIVYPNPASSILQIHLNGNDIIEELSIVDLAGQTIYRSGTVAWEHGQVDINDLPNGTYFAIARTQTGRVARKFEVIR